MDSRIKLFIYGFVVLFFVCIWQAAMIDSNCVAVEFGQWVQASNCDPAILPSLAGSGAGKNNSIP